jgi:hypothetical protein
MDHECLHEVDLALMADRQKRTLDAQEAIQKTLDKIDTTLNGNGKDGLKQRMGKDHTRLNIQWWMIGGIFLGIIGLAIRNLI